MEQQNVVLAKQGANAVRDVVVFSELDRVILESYKRVAEGIAKLLGEHCEIVLHSLENLQYSAIYVVNGKNTQRYVGAPITDLALKKLHNLKANKEMEAEVYFTQTKGGVLMKSMTIPITNSLRIIGLLCININLDAPFSSVIQSFLPSNSSNTPAPVNFATSIDELVQQTIDESIQEINADVSISNHSKNKQIVFNLFSKGIFDIKDAINLVANALGISKHTVYLYIRQFKNDTEHDAP